MPLHSLHDAQKVVHRDVRPDNMLPSQHDEVLLSGFGIAGKSDEVRNCRRERNNRNGYFHSRRPRLSS